MQNLVLMHESQPQLTMTGQNPGLWMEFLPEAYLLIPLSLNSQQSTRLQSRLVRPGEGCVAPNSCNLILSNGSQNRPDCHEKA